MFTRCMFILRCVVAGLLMSVACGALAAAPVVRLAFEDKDSFPNYLGDGVEIDWKRPGFAVEFLKLVGDELKITFEFSRYPWKRCLMLTETSEVDGAFNASYSAERQKTGRYPMTRGGEVDAERRITDMTYVLYRLKGGTADWDGKQFVNLQGGSIGAVNGYSIAKALRDNGHPVEDGAINSHNLADKLIAGRIPLMASSDMQMEHILAADPKKYGRVERLKLPYQHKPYYLLFSHKFYAENPVIAERIWTTIGRLRESPRVQKIRAKYRTP